MPSTFPAVEYDSCLGLNPQKKPFSVFYGCLEVRNISVFSRTVLLMEGLQMSYIFFGELWEVVFYDGSLLDFNLESL